MNSGYVPASYTAKVKRDEKASADLIKQRATRKTDLKAKREQWRARAQKYHENHLASNLNLIKERRLARNTGDFFVAPEAKVMFVIRLKG
jgi:large subunit ribosomal protein L7e